LIDLCATVFDWAKFTRAKGAVKLHLLLDHDGYLPQFALITDGRVHEIRFARQLSFAPGTVLVVDKGFTDYHLFHRWSQAGVFFVTRMRANAVYRVVEERPVPQHRGILKDQVVYWANPRFHFGSPQHYRRIEVVHPDSGEVWVLLSNHLAWGATTLAAIYKDRWQIELFFRALKQNLKIKTFVGTSANALKIQIWTALIAMLLLRFLQLRARFGWHLSNLIALLRMNLFTHRDLWTWIDQPFQPPPVEVDSVQQQTFSFV